MARADVEQYRLNSVDRAVAVLKAVSEVGPAPLDLTAQTAGLSESTTLRYVSSLVRHGLLERDEEDGRYRLGLELYRLGRKAATARPIDAVARPILEVLRDQSGETVNLGAKHGRQLILLEVLQSPLSLRKGATARGESDFWHSTSLGKAILAETEEQEMLAILRSEELVAFTPSSITTEERMVEELAATRERGYAIDDEESDEGLRCVGVAVRDESGVARYAISVSGPKSRMSYSRIQELATRLKGAGKEISRMLGGDLQSAGGASLAPAPRI